MSKRMFEAASNCNRGLKIPTEDRSALLRRRETVQRQEASTGALVSAVDNRFRKVGRLIMRLGGAPVVDRLFSTNKQACSQEAHVQKAAELLDTAFSDGPQGLELLASEVQEWRKYALPEASGKTGLTENRGDQFRL
uniref:Uncharacterized protein n=1 Tax=Globodera rostochiensis TaxID=31243 RepID=A0A914IEY7_GLORO